MGVRDVFSARIVVSEMTGYPDYLPAVYEDITSGILNVDIKTGIDYYEGPWQQPDTGQFTIVTRNPNLDPKVNPNIKYNAVIEFLDSRIDPEYSQYNKFFTGFVTDINVEYVRNDNPIITINGTDVFGLLQRMFVTSEMEQEVLTIGDGNGCTFQQFLETESFSNLTYKYAYFSFEKGESNLGGSLEGRTINAYRPAKFIPKAGENLLEVINKYAQTNLDSFVPVYNVVGAPTQIYIYPFIKYNSGYWTPQQDPALEYPTYQFSSDPADNASYQTITVDNGYNRVTNQLEFSNEYRFVDAGEIKSQTDSFGDYISEESINEWAITKTSINTYFPQELATETEMERYAKDIFQIVAFPTDQIQNITFDNAKSDFIEANITYSNYSIRDFVRIKHQLSNTEIIDRFYDIGGISHSISPNEWTMGFIFKPSEQEIAFAYQGQIPVIEMNSLTGDTNFDFTATITQYPVEDIDNLYWELGGFQYDPEAYWERASTGERYKDNTPRTAISQTWNFDDDGILNTPYGPGYWHVIPYITLNSGWTITPEVVLTVGSPVVAADFQWEQNLTNNYAQVFFTDNSRNNEVGEPDSYIWDFGDGTTSNEVNPTHTYAVTPGQYTYDVSLTVYAFFGGGTSTKTTTVTLVEPSINADFTFTQNNQVVTFTNTSTNVGAEVPGTYLWEFGDGTTATTKNAVHTFPIYDSLTESYDVKLTVKNVWQTTDEVTKTVTVTGLNKSGTLGVTNVRLRVDDFNSTTTGFRLPYMIFLKARKSNTLENIIYLRPTTKAGTSNIVWYEADGTTHEIDDPYNLTRDPAVTPNSQYGLTPEYVSSGTTGWTLDTSCLETNTINDIVLTFRDRLPDTNPATYPQKINVDVSDGFGGWLNIGYFKLPPGRMQPGSPSNVIGNSTKTMTALRPMPPNIPYFKYTFNNTVATFTSMETADSYLWNFGDGTTSTLKDPVHTFPKRGTYTVSLQVTNGGVVTRTTTEPVIVEALAPFDIKYIKFAQNTHDGTHAFDTPYVANMKVNYLTDNVASGDQIVLKHDDATLQYRIGTDGQTIINPVGTTRLTGGGYRIKSYDASFVSEYDLVVNLGQVYNGITDVTVELGRWTATGYPETLAAGISYSVYVTDYVGTTPQSSSVTWTKVGEFNPTSIPLNASATYSIIPT